MTNGQWKSWVLVVSVVVAWSPWCSADADEPQPAAEHNEAGTNAAADIPSEAQIKHWVRELGDDDVDIRDAAKEQLLSLGAGALRYLANAHQGRQESGRQASQLASVIEKDLIASLNVPGVSFSNGFGHVRTIWIDDATAARAILPRLDWFRYLVRMQLAGSQITDGEFQLIDADLRYLSTLDLRKTKVTDKSLTVVSGCANLNELLLPDGVKGHGLNKLRAAKNLSVLSASGLTDDGLAGLDVFARLTELDLTGSPVSDSGLKHLAKLPLLKSLRLAKTKISDKGLAVLSALPQLESLDLRGTAVSSAGLVHLKDHERLALVHLDQTKVDRREAEQLSRGWNKAFRIGDVTAAEVDHWVAELDGETRAVRNTARRVLLHSCPDAIPYLYALEKTAPTVLLRRRAHEIRDEFEWNYRDSLKTLDVQCSGSTYVSSLRLYDAATARYLLPKLKAFAGLDALFLDRSDIGNNELRLIDGPLPRLQYLSLYSSEVTDDGLQHLGKLPNLQDVNLFRCRIQGFGLKHLASLTNLELLSLSDTRIDDESVGVLAQLRHLTGVDLGGTGITDTGLSQIVGMKQLKYLNLERTRITDAGLKLLAQLQDLEELHLTETNTDDESLGHLRSLTRLKHLGLGGTRVTAEGLASLVKELKHLELINIVDTMIDEHSARQLEERSRIQIHSSNK